MAAEYIADAQSAVALDKATRASCCSPALPPQLALVCWWHLPRQRPAMAASLACWRQHAPEYWCHREPVCGALQEHDRAAHEQEAARKAAEELQITAAATQQLAMAAAGILFCPLPPPGSKREPGRHAAPPPPSRWPGGVTDALEDEDIAAAFGVDDGELGKIGAAWFTAGRNGALPAGRSGVSNFSSRQPQVPSHGSGAGQLPEAHAASAAHGAVPAHQQ